MRNQLRPDIICFDDYGFEMPTKCDCGTWFEFSEGFGSKTRRVTICSECHDIEEEISDFQAEIQNLTNEVANGKNILKNKRQLKAMKVKLRHKEEQLTLRML